MTRKQLAEAAGINAVYLSQIEKGGSCIGSARTLAAIAEALDIDVDALIWNRARNVCQRLSHLRST